MKDYVLLFTTRAVRMFSYGALTLVFVIAMLEMFSIDEFNALVAGILLGDMFITLYLTTSADRIGRRLVLVVGALLKCFAGAMFASTNNFALLWITGVIGVVSPTGGDVGPFISVEQACLAQIALAHGDSSSSHAATLTSIMGWYQLTGAISLASGTAFAGWLVSYLRTTYHYTDAAAYRAIFLFYAAMGLVKFLLYLMLSASVELPPKETGSPVTTKFFWSSGLRSSSKGTVAKLSALFSLDSFAGGLVLQSFIAWWFHAKWGMSEAELGMSFFVVNVLAGVSGLAAASFVRMFGAVNTMVFTHFPSNILLLLIPFMPTKETALAMLWARFAISQMDVPARQAYVAVVVDASERSAAGGWTNCARSLGVATAPLLLQAMGSEKVPHNKLHYSLSFNAPFIVSGVLKCIYDVSLYISFYTSRQVGSHSTDSQEKKGGGGEGAAATKDGGAAAAAGEREGLLVSMPPNKQQQYNTLGK